MADFDDIRPYNDQEVLAALKRLVADKECLDLIAKSKFPRAFKLSSSLLRPLVRWNLSQRLKSIHSVEDFQKVVESYLTSMLDKTTEGLTITGVENLDLSTPCLFMSNHRDITLDPALTNYALFHNGGQTVRIAIGDNLLSKPFVTDLMRSNKSFIVKRSLNRPRELFKALKNLSAYVWHSLKEDGENVWIAHREGRAKDGIDKSEPAVIKMLTIAKPKQLAFSDYIKQLRIVPVSVSYEYDPCDAMKASELRMIETTGSYIKSEHEDMDSIGKGISGYKGHIYLHFGERLNSEYENADEVAKALDIAITKNYRIQPSNILAYELLHGKDKLLALRETNGLLSEEEGRYSEQDRTVFHDRIAAMSDEDTVWALNIYANPVLSRIEACRTGELNGIK